MTTDALYRPSSPGAPRSSYWLLCASLLLHILLLLLAARPFKEPPPKINDTPSAIKATLVYPQFVAPPLPLSKQPPVPRVEKQVAHEVVKESALTVAAKLAVIKTIPPVKQKTGNLTTTKPGVVRGNQGATTEEQLDRQLKGFNQQAIADIAAKEAALYRQQKNSPSLLGKPAANKLSEDEKFRKARQVRANCSSRVNQGIAILSMITGGSIACTEAPGVGSFIQERIDKSAHLPAQDPAGKP